MSADSECVGCEGEQGKQCQFDCLNVFYFLIYVLDYCWFFCAFKSKF